MTNNDFVKVRKGRDLGNTISTYLPQSDASCDQSLRTMSSPLISCSSIILPLGSLVTARAAYFFFFSSKMYLYTPSISSSSNLYNLLTSNLTWNYQNSALIIIAVTLLVMRKRKRKKVIRCDLCNYLVFYLENHIFTTTNYVMNKCQHNSFTLTSLQYLYTLV